MPSWHIRAIAHQLERLNTGEIQRLLITMPPRSLKSICVSVAFPASSSATIPPSASCASPTLKIWRKIRTRHARRHGDQLVSATFPATRISKHKSADLDFETTRRGGRLATSVGGTLTGRGGSLIIIDDPQKPADATSEKRRAATRDWFRNTLSSRLDDPRNDAIVVVMQRLHVDDLAGHLIESGGWTHLNLPAIAMEEQTIELSGGRRYVRHLGELLEPKRLPKEELDRLRATLGSFYFTAQYQQEPIPEGGNLIKADWLASYASLPPLKAPARIVQSWDLAVRDGETNDWSVGITAQVRGNLIHIIDVVRQRLDFPAQRRLIVSKAKEFQASVILIEASATGDPLIADLRHLNGAGIPTPIALRPRGSKLERLAIQSHRIGPVTSCCRSVQPGARLSSPNCWPSPAAGTTTDDALSQLLA